MTQSGAEHGGTLARRLDSFRGKRVLVTGAAGFIGRWVARRLTEAECQLFLVVRDAAAARRVADAYGLRGQVLAADLTDSKALTGLFREVQPQVTFHLVGYGVDAAERSEPLAKTMNVDVVKQVAEIVAGLAPTDWTGARLVHVGSTAEYGPAEGPVTEATATRPTSTYGITKLAGTQGLAQVAGRSGLRALTARLFTVYGPGEHAGRLLPSLLRTARSGEPLPMTSGEQQRDFTYVGDAAEALLRLACVCGPLPAVVNVATGKLTTVREFVQEAARILGLHSRQLEFGRLAQRRDDLQQGTADTSLLDRLTGWRPATGIAEGIRQTVALENEFGSAREVHA